MTEHPVVLAGAGPGDPELLTLAALRALAAADVVVHDRLVDARVLERCRHDAVRVCVGKQKGGGWDQRAIEALLVEHALAGRRVVRLKGGDPFVFGRGGEEVDALRAAGLEVRVIPGISSALAAPAAAGISVTRRGVAAACTIVSGHVLHELDWAAIATVPGTIVVLMASTTAREVARELLAGGRPPGEPVAVVHAATLPDECSRRTTLAELAEQGALAPSPAVLVIGAVAALECAATLQGLAATVS